MKSIFLLCAISLFVIPDRAFGQLGIGSGLKIDFTKLDDAKKKAVWSDPKILSISQDGLGWDGAPSGLREGWFETKPVAIGLSWRAARAVYLGVVVRPAKQVANLPKDQKPMQLTGSAFVRHSPDDKHWSAWQALSTAKNDDESVRAFSGTVAIAGRDQVEYGRLGSEYRNLDVPWQSDEEALAHWIVKRHPDFFRDHKPFIGYVQFLFENSFWGGHCIASFDASLNVELSGMSTFPRDPDVAKDRDGPWRFRAN